MTEETRIETFGKFIINNLRDSSIDFCEKLLEGRWKAQKLQKIQQGLQEFTSEQKELIRKSVVASIDTAIHDFLYALEENNETTKDIKILVNEQNVLSLGTSLRNQLFSDSGWFATMSRYKIQF